MFNTNPKFLWGEHCKTYQKSLEFRGNATFAEKRFDVKRVFWRALDQELERCDSSVGATAEGIDPSKCMTDYVERKAGCRSNLMKSDPAFPVCDRKENVSAVLFWASEFWEADENLVNRHGFTISSVNYHKNLEMN